jgi:hypothetical protein
MVLRSTQAQQQVEWILTQGIQPHQLSQTAVSKVHSLQHSSTSQQHVLEGTLSAFFARNVLCHSLLLVQTVSRAAAAAAVLQDRIGRNMIDDAEAKGLIKPGGAHGVQQQQQQQQ